jgi:rhamnogalacturonan endolyase
MTNTPAPELKNFTLPKNFAARFLVGLCWLAWWLCLMSPREGLANVPGGGSAGPEVTLTESDGNVILANGILTATIRKANAGITSLKFRGYEMLNAGYYSMDGGERYRQPARCFFSVKTRTPDLVDLSLKSVWQNEAQAFDIEVHYVLRRGASGLYSYAILSHPANYPATTVGEWRMVWKLSNELLEKIYVDDFRHWQMPAASDYQQAQRTPIAEIVKLTTGAWAGRYDCKYDYSAEYWDLGCWGHASDKNKIGGWIVLGGHEFFNDGPTKQDLTAASGINHLHFGLNHYNASGIQVAAGETWQKLFGPFLLFCNYNPAGGDACWADAKAQAKAESAAWPYSWLNNPAYPLAGQRGAITGRFIVRDSLKPTVTAANAWVGVAQPPANGNWQFESKHYQFWVRTDAQGNFTIPNVRPGSYTLYAFTDGAVGEFSKPGVMINAGQMTALGELTWDVSHKGKKIAWEIGVPDRTAKEFRHGTDYFHGYLWENFAQEFPNPLDYTVGQSHWSTDWNYAQARYSGANPPNGSAPWKWRIHFALTNVPPGTATLTLAIASAQKAAIAVYVNDESQPFTRVSPSVQGGNALLREGIHAKYCVEYVSIPTARLKTGDNVITLALLDARSADAHVMYDYLNLELP